MKKIFALLSVLSILSIPAFAAEEAVVTSLESETAEATTTPRILNDFTDFSHWSLSLNVGMSQFDGDVSQKYDQILSNSMVI